MVVLTFSATLSFPLISFSALDNEMTKVTMGKLFLTLQLDMKSCVFENFSDFQSLLLTVLSILGTGISAPVAVTESSDRAGLGSESERPNLISFRDAHSVIR